VGDGSALDDVPAEISEHKGDEREDVRVIRADPKRLSSNVDTGAPGRLRVLGPAVDLDPLVTADNMHASR
jgi:hypothetical protein